MIFVLFSRSNFSKRHKFFVRFIFGLQMSCVVIDWLLLCWTPCRCYILEPEFQGENVCVPFLPVSLSFAPFHQWKRKKRTELQSILWNLQVFDKIPQRYSKIIVRSFFEWNFVRVTFPGKENRIKKCKKRLFYLLKQHAPSITDHIWSIHNWFHVR